MKISLNFIIGSLVVATVAGIECPTDFFEAGNGCFGIFEQPSPGETDLTWPQARELCQATDLPGFSVDLATFEDTAQLEAVSVSWAEIKDNTAPFMWIGINRYSGTWEYIDGRVIALTSNIWQETHPHDMNMHVYLDDVTVSTGEHSYGRLYAACTSKEFMRHYMCRAIPT